MLNHNKLARCAAGLLTVALPGIALLAVALLAVTGARAAGPPTLDEIKSQIAKQPARLQSLYIEVSSENRLTVDPKIYLSLPGHERGVILLKEEEQYAFKADKRYSRRQCPAVVKSPWPVKPPEVDPTAGRVEQAIQRRIKEQYEQQKRMAGPARIDEGPRDEWRLMPEETFAMNGKLQWNRRLSAYGKSSQLFLHGPKESMHWGQQPWYLTSIGWFVPDPTEHGEKPAAPQQVTYLNDLLSGKRYTVAETIETVDGARCAVLHTRHDETQSAYGVSEVLTLDDTLWLDLDRGLALKQREYIFGKNQITRTVNRDFVEVVPGIWFPKDVTEQHLVPPSGPAEYRGKPMRVSETKLTKWVVNQVPDDLFDIVPRSAKEERVWDMRTQGTAR